MYLVMPLLKHTGIVTFIMKSYIMPQRKPKHYRNFNNSEKYSWIRKSNSFIDFCLNLSFPLFSSPSMAVSECLLWRRALCYIRAENCAPNDGKALSRAKNLHTILLCQLFGRTHKFGCFNQWNLFKSRHIYGSTLVQNVVIVVVVLGFLYFLSFVFCFDFMTHFAFTHIRFSVWVW